MDRDKFDEIKYEVLSAEVNEDVTLDELIIINKKLVSERKMSIEDFNDWIAFVPEWMATTYTEERKIFLDIQDIFRDIKCNAIAGHWVKFPIETDADRLITVYVELENGYNWYGQPLFYFRGNPQNIVKYVSALLTFRIKEIKID